METTESELLGGRVRLLQPRRGYRVAVDPLLLQAAVPARSGELVLDAGAGTGAAAICLAVRVPGCRVIAVERDPAMAELLRTNVARNRLEERIEVLEADVAELPARLRGRPVHHAMTNPPHLDPARARAPQAQVHAFVETLPLPAWLAATAAVLRPRGWLVVVHRAERWADLARALPDGFGDLRLFPLWPRAGRTFARRLLFAARRGVRSPAVLLSGLVLHDDGGYTPEAEAVLRRGAALPLCVPPAELRA